MNLKNTKSLTAAALLVTISSGQAAVYANFDSLTAGTVTGADLNAVTTGGIWFLPGRGATHTAVDDGSGNTAVVSDDLANNAGDQNLIALTATAGNEINLATSDALLTFRVSAARTGSNKGLRYRFRSLTNGNIGTLDWNHNLNALILNVGETSETSITLATPERFSSSNTGQTVWNPAAAGVHDVSVLFSGTTFTVTFGSETISTSFVNTALTDVGRLQVFTTGTAAGAKGAWLDDVSLIAVPEPSTSILSAIGGLALLSRRRR